MDLKQVAKEINEILEKRRKEIDLRFVEAKHTYFMRDETGKIRANYPSVSKLIKMFHPYFDADKKALEMCKGDVNKAKKLIAEWNLSGTISTNLGSRSHFLLEQDLIGRYDNYKEVRQPIFKCDQTQIDKSDRMVIAGKEFLDLMHERGAILIDTEAVLGDPELGYTGQPDNAWLMENKSKTGLGIVITDWKTNQPKNFEVQIYTKKMFPPFEQYDDIALRHYCVQIPLYGRLMLKMLKGSIHENIKMLGGVIVLLKEDATFVEYKVPHEMVNTVLTMDITKYTKK